MAEIIKKGALSEKERLKSLAAVIACITAVGMGLGLSIPLLALQLEQRGTDTALIGLNTAMPALATLVFTPFIPALLRRVQPDRFLLVCMALSAACMPCYFLFPNIWAWFPIRFINGIALTGLFVVSEFWINQLADEKSRGKLIGLYGAILSGGFAIGPLILALVGSEGALPFLIVSFLTVSASIPLFLAWGLAPRVEEAPSRGLLTFLFVAPAATLAGLIYGATETNIFNLLPIYALRTGQTAETAALVLTVFGAGNILFQIPIGALADRMDRRLVLLICAGFGFAGTALLPLVSQSIYLFIPSLFVFGGVVVGMYTVGLTLLGERFRGADLASANATFVMLYSVGALAGPPLAGLSMDVWDPHGLAVFMAGLIGVYLILVGWRYSTPKPRDPMA
jgi:MFS family permease